ncbi:MAG TPA: hypothetical protein VF914_06480 [Chloroflexia bacterium]|jgi:hypothetical protein
MEKNWNDEKEGERQSGRESATSQLFLVRLWKGNENGDGRVSDAEEHRVEGKVQHVLSGEATSFNDWPALMELLKGMTHVATRPPAQTREKQSN